MEAAHEKGGADKLVGRGPNRGTHPVMGPFRGSGTTALDTAARGVTCHRHREGANIPVIERTPAEQQATRERTRGGEERKERRHGKGEQESR